MVPHDECCSCCAVVPLRMVPQVSQSCARVVFGLVPRDECCWLWLGRSQRDRFACIDALSHGHFFVGSKMHVGHQASWCSALLCCTIFYFETLGIGELQKCLHASHVSCVAPFCLSNLDVLKLFKYLLVGHMGSLAHLSIKFPFVARHLVFTMVAASAPLMSLNPMVAGGGLKRKPSSLHLDGARPTPAKVMRATLVQNDLDEDRRKLKKQRSDEWEWEHMMKNAHNDNAVVQAVEEMSIDSLRWPDRASNPSSPVPVTPPMTTRRRLAQWSLSPLWSSPTTPPPAMVQSPEAAWQSMPAITDVDKKTCFSCGQLFII